MIEFPTQPAEGNVTHQADHARSESRQHAKTKPPCLPVERLHREGKAEAGLTPYTSLITSGDFKFVTVRRQAGILRAPLRPTLDPLGVEPFQAIAKLNIFR